MNAELIDNTAHRRFEMKLEGRTVFAEYLREGTLVTLIYVETPPALRGRGVAGDLLRKIAVQARAQGWSLKPECSYAANWFQRHEEYHHLLA